MCFVFGVLIGEMIVVVLGEFFVVFGVLSGEIGFGVGGGGF